MTHYQPLLPAPHYPSAMEYRHQLNQIAHRFQTHLVRKASRDTGSFWSWADDYSPKQADDDRLALRAAYWHLFEPARHAAVLPERRHRVTTSTHIPVIPDTGSMTLGSRYR